MPSRGVARPSKGKPHRPKKPKPAAEIDEDEDQWATTEVKKTGILIRKGWRYLESELRRLTKEEGNADKVAKLVKGFADRQDRALRIQQEAIQRAGQAAVDPHRGRYNLSG